MLYLDADQLRRALPMAEAITAMEAAFGTDREIPVRQQLGVSLFMPGRVGQYTGVKVVSTVPGNPAGLVLVVGPKGQPIGLVDGPTLTAIRTAAAPGLLTDRLAAPDASTLAMLGAGAMATDQVAAIRAVRPINRVLVWSRTSRSATMLARAVDGEVCLSADKAVAAADIVSTATPSTVPLFSPEAVRPGTHINAVGAFTPEMVEIPPSTVREAFVVVDDRAAAAAEAGDLLQADRNPDAEVADILNGTRPHSGENITLFKSVGIASQDIAAAVRALEIAETQRLGQTL